MAYVRKTLPKFTNEMRTQFIEALANGEYNISEIVERIGNGLSVTAFYYQARKPEFQKDLKLACNGTLPLHVREVKNAMLDSGVKGDSRSAKVYLESEGEYQQRIKVEGSLSDVIRKINAEAGNDEDEDNNK